MEQDIEVMYRGHVVRHGRDLTFFHPEAFASARVAMMPESEIEDIINRSGHDIIAQFRGDGGTIDTLKKRVNQKHRTMKLITRALEIGAYNIDGSGAGVITANIGIRSHAGRGSPTRQVKIENEGLDRMIVKHCACEAYSNAMNKANFLTEDITGNNWTENAYVDFLMKKEIIKEASEVKQEYTVRMTDFHAAALMLDLWDQKNSDIPYTISEDLAVAAAIVRYVQRDSGSKTYGMNIDQVNSILFQHPIITHSLQSLIDKDKAEHMVLKQSRNMNHPMKLAVFAMDYTARKSGYTFRGFVDEEYKGMEGVSLRYTKNEDDMRIAMFDEMNLPLTVHRRTIPGEHYDKRKDNVTGKDMWTIVRWPKNQAAMDELLEAGVFKSGMVLSQRLDDIGTVIDKDSRKIYRQVFWGRSLAHIPSSEYHGTYDITALDRIIESERLKDGEKSLVLERA